MPEPTPKIVRAAMAGCLGERAHETATRAKKLSEFAGEFFRRLGAHLGRPMLLRKSDLHRLIEFLDPVSIPSEVNDKLDRIAQLFDAARGEGGQGS